MSAASQAAASNSASRPLKIVLISPKGPLYRHRGGSFRRSLRYMPLTLPTLAALIPDDARVEVTCIDEGIADVDLDLARAALPATSRDSSVSVRVLAYRIAAKE